MRISGQTHYTIGEVADRYGVQVWRVRRLFERGLLPPADRIGNYRVISADALTQVEEALRAAGYIGAPEITPGA